MKLLFTYIGAFFLSIGIIFAFVSAAIVPVLSLLNLNLYTETGRIGLTCDKLNNLVAYSVCGFWSYASILGLLILIMCLVALILWGLFELYLYSFNLLRQWSIKNKVE